MECCIIPINRSFVRSFVLHIHVRTVLYSYDLLLLLARANPRPCFNPGMGAGGHGVAVCVCVYSDMIDRLHLGFEISFLFIYTFPTDIIATAPVGSVPAAVPILVTSYFDPYWACNSRKNGVTVL